MCVCVCVCVCVCKREREGKRIIRCVWAGMRRWIELVLILWCVELYRVVEKSGCDCVNIDHFCVCV